MNDISSRASYYIPTVVVSLLMAYVLLIGLNTAQAASETTKRRIFIVSSYNRDYLWSQSTHAGVTAAMLRYSYLDNQAQAKTFSTRDYIESSRAILKKAWMNTNRHNAVTEIATATKRIIEDIRTFQPDLVLLGDDNAANYIGNQLLDTEIPTVFWGINGLPLKYGLVDSMDRPGHNVTGVWQAGYYKESMELLHKLLPQIRTFAILACGSVTARPKVKQIEALARQGKLPMNLVDVVQTNSYEEFQRRALELAKQVDAFFILNHDTLRDSHGNHVDMLTAGRWYLNNIRKPEASHEGQFVREGMLLTANDSGYKQGYTAFEIAYDILEQGLNPGLIRTKTPSHGPLMINRRRAEMLGIDLEDKLDYIDEIVDKALALQQ